MTSPQTKVSIGMPVYNSERYLRSALDSLLSQTFTDFELVISDNASTDETEVICREYASRDSRVKYHRQEENHGAIWNFNRAFELSNGEYFKWAAYDDLCEPTLLEKCVDCLEQRPDVIWCSSQVLHMDADGKVIDADDDPIIPDGEPAHSMLITGQGLPEKTRASLTSHERFEGVLLGTTWCSDSYGLIRSAAIRKTRMYLQCYGAEKVLMGELALQGRYAQIPEVLFYERIHGEASGALLTAEAQRSFAGDSGKQFTSTRWELLKGHLAAVMHAPLGWSERIRCLAVLLKYVFQINKWRRVLTQAFAGVGIGAETRTEHEIGDQSRAATTDSAALTHTGALT